MKRKAKPTFDPKVFLAKANGGRTISTHPKKSVIFAQGDAADAVFYIKSGKVKVAIVSKRARKPLSQFSGRTNSLARGY